MALDQEVKLRLHFRTSAALAEQSVVQTPASIGREAQERFLAGAVRDSLGYLSSSVVDQLALDNALDGASSGTR